MRWRGWLAARGVTAFVLFYRLPHEGWASGPDTPLADAQRAMRLIRHRAARYGVDPRADLRDGLLRRRPCLRRSARPLRRPGLRAASTPADRLSARPDLAAPIYPVVSMSAAGRPCRIAPQSDRRECLARARARAFAAPQRSGRCAADLPPPCRGRCVGAGREQPAAARRACWRRGVPVETHLFADGGHGFGLRLARGKSGRGLAGTVLRLGPKAGIVRVKR